MTVASAIITDIRKKLGDSAGDFLDSDLALTWLDQAQKIFVTKLLPLRRTKGFTVSANQDFFAIPDDAIMIQIVLHSRDIRRPLTRVTPGEFELARSRVQNATGIPTIWTEKDNRVYVWPRYSTAGNSSTLNATTEASATTLTLASTGVLRTYGRAIIGSEEVSYTNKTSTTLTGVTRGEGGTTAASYASAQAINQADVEITYARHAVALASTAEPEIREVYHENLELYVAYLFYMSEGNVPKAQAMYALWEKSLKDAEYNIRRQHISNPLRVAEADSMRVRGFWNVST